jgi:hypothetical protein
LIETAPSKGRGLKKNPITRDILQWAHACLNDIHTRQAAKAAGALISEAHEFYRC